MVQSSKRKRANSTVSKKKKTPKREKKKDHTLNVPSFFFYCRPKTLKMYAKRSEV